MSIRPIAGKWVALVAVSALAASVLPTPGPAQATEHEQITGSFVSDDTWCDPGATPAPPSLTTPSDACSITDVEGNTTAGAWVKGGAPMRSVDFYYDNVSCTDKDDLGQPVDVVEPDSYGYDSTEEDGSFQFNAVKDQCYAVRLVDPTSFYAPLVVYNGVVGGYALIDAGATDVIINKLPAPSVPLAVTFKGARKGTLAQLTMRRPDGYFEPVDETHVGSWTNETRTALGWADTNPLLDTTAFFWAMPGMEYTVSYSGDETHYPQYIIGVDALTADEDAVSTFTVLESATSLHKTYTLKAGSSARGQVEFAGGSVPADAQVTALRVISEYDEEWDQEWEDVVPELTADVAADGSYVLRPLLPATEYQVCVTAPTFADACLGDIEIDPDDPRWEDPSWDPWAGAENTFTSAPAYGEATVPSIALAHRTGAIAGQLSGFSAASGYAYAVSLSDGGEYWAAELGGSKYRIDGLPAGMYLLVARGFNADGDEDRGSETIVAVSEGRITAQDINVAPTGKLPLTVGPRADWNGKLGHTEVKIAPEPQVGQTLRATVTTKRNNVTPKYSFYWTDGASIIGEGPELTVGQELQGKQISVFVLVTGEKAWPRWAQTTAGDAALRPQLSPDTPPMFSEGAEPQVGTKTVVDIGSWDLEPDQVQYQWLLDDEAIPGATGPSHIPAPDQVYGMLSLQLTLLRQHHEPTTWTVMADDLVAPGPEATFAATVSGKAAVGKRLKASRAPVGWDASYQWLRSGEPIRNATSRSYKLRKADAGAEISVAVTATKPGYTETTEFSPAKSVPKFKSTIKVTRPKASNPRKFTVRVKIKGTADTGKIRVTVGTFSKTYKLKKGKATPKLPNLSKGSHKVKVTYLGTSQNAKSTKKAVFRFR